MKKLENAAATRHAVKRGSDAGKTYAAEPAGSGSAVLKSVAKRSWGGILTVDGNHFVAVASLNGVFDADPYAVLARRLPDLETHADMAFDLIHSVSVTGSGPIPEEENPRAVRKAGNLQQAPQRRSCARSRGANRSISRAADDGGVNEGRGGGNSERPRISRAERRSERRAVRMVILSGRGGPIIPARRNDL
ncbi:hypothetical protein [Mesorhizobium sp. B4-1-4]|uniref:hypothetical protein n=1 Tax=Mesorhizobium sp. B4-1-4 TaxID=2589888 RepID=UPI0015E2A86C|nr:hypothetical protein [Mesorhizobium sp. B4-1-4]UCI32054.1 hypothetical protein FJW03_00895 [Mesorhizobium sp. B4-1-4]